MTLAAITLDLDDTLWPVWPTIQRAERQMWAWLADHAPATAAARNPQALAAIRAQVLADRPDWRHDLGALRRECVRRALLQSGDDPALAVPAYELFYAERQRVDLFDDVLPALARLASRWPIIALTNGNADVQRVPGLAPFFKAAVSAHDLGVGKPDAAIFQRGCQLAGSVPGQTLHVGDDGPLDIDGALAAGLQAAWVRRRSLPEPAAPLGEPQHRVRDLTELATRLGV